MNTDPQPAANASERETCPRCGSLVIKEGSPSKRIFFACESYRYEGEENLRDQTDLCATREELKDRERELAEATRKLADETNRCDFLIGVVDRWKATSKSQAEEIEWLRASVEELLSAEYSQALGSDDDADQSTVYCVQERARKALAAQNP